MLRLGEGVVFFQSTPFLVLDLRMVTILPDADPVLCRAQHHQSSFQNSGTQCAWCGAHELHPGQTMWQLERGDEDGT